MASPDPAVVPPAELSWVDLAGFWVDAVGTVASVVIAAVAIWLSVRAARAEQRRSEIEAEAAKRERRSDLGRDIIIWLDRSTVHLALGGDSAILDSEWVRVGEELAARSRVIDSPGATELLVAAREARDAVEGVALGRRMRVAIDMTKLLQLWATRWVEDPQVVSYPVREWVDQFDAVVGEGRKEFKRDAAPEA